MTKKNNNTLLIAGGLLAVGVIYALATKKEEGPDEKLVECSIELTTFTGLMNVREQIGRYKGKAPCMHLIEQYVANNQAAEYAKLVAEGKMNQDQAAAGLTIDVETINGEIRMMSV